MRSIERENFLESKFSKSLDFDGFFIEKKKKLFKDSLKSEISFIELDDKREKDFLKEKDLKEVIFFKNFNLKFFKNFQRKLKENGIKIPLVLYVKLERKENFIGFFLKLSTLLLKNAIEGVCIREMSKKSLNSLLLILQIFKKRFFRAEYISCPGCGRTLFDIEKITKKVKGKTAHLKNIKIAVMGCVVNGAGEMKDADFGILGASKGMVDLYRGKRCVERGVPIEKADEKLLFHIEKNR
jgi:(E)-4-hydroxy-3-methylbut-2-enyl-diphosphate synthase